jgi:hypothetical protein
MKTASLTKIAVIALIATIAGQTQAQVNKSLASARGFICAPRIMPSTDFKPGTIFYTSQSIVLGDIGLFPNKTDTYTYDDTGVMEYLNADGTPAITVETAKKFREYSGMTYTEKTTVGAVLDLVVNEQKVGEYKANAKLNNKLDKTVTINQVLPTHKGIVLTDKDLSPVFNWWKQTKLWKDPEYRAKAFYVVREVRFSDQLTYNVNKDTLLKSGINITAEGLGNINAEGSVDSKGTFSLPAKFEKPLIFCYKAHRLNPVRD